MNPFAETRRARRNRHPCSSSVASASWTPASTSTLPGFIRDAGLFHDSGGKVPAYVGTKTPENVADAVVSAIEHDRAEVVVAPPFLRFGSAVASLAPDVAARVQRRLGADRIASSVTSVVAAVAVTSPSTGRA